MLIGAHVSTAGGLENALQRGRQIGAEALQIFPSAPLQWRIRGWSDEACAEFKTTWPKEFQQVIFHGIYLTNLAGASADNLAKTKTALIETLQLAPKLGIALTVFHPGSHAGGLLGNQQQVREAVKEILENTPEESRLVYENSAGSTIGGKLEDLAWLLENSSVTSRVGVCLDTCHAFAAGYNIATEEGYAAYVGEVERLIGADKVLCWHFNDSKFPLGAKRDRHENIGEGQMGRKPFELILNDRRWQNLAGYLEVPGYDNKGPDKANVETLRSLRTG
jgi:deoxyribonuclease IV